jgi:hypothetical protein
MPFGHEKRRPRAPFFILLLLPATGQAALSHIAVSNALLIRGMLHPKVAFALALLLVFAAGFSTGATSVARSHWPLSWERATEKNRST